MFVTGHLSTSYLLCRFSGLHLRIALLAAVFPDLVDKPLQVIGLATTGRHIAHNLFALVLSSLLIALWPNWRAGLSWFWGYSLHLLGDLPYSWVVPWLYPLEYGTWHNSVETGLFNLAVGQIALDLSITAAAILVLLWGRIRRARSISGPLAGEGSGTGIA